jgi:hypothetical protein
VFLSVAEDMSATGCGGGKCGVVGGGCKPNTPKDFIYSL